MDILIAVPFIITCVLLILVVLLQKGRGGGLGAALGGAGSAAFGTKVGDFMTWVTIVLTALFLLLAIGGALYFRPPETQAEKPIFQPDAKSAIAEEIRVTLVAADPESDKIYYTKTTDPNDDAAPSRTNGDLYKNAFPVSPGTIVKAIAYPQRGDPSEVVTMRYRAPQPDPPVVTPMPDPQDPITKATEVTITAGGKDDKLYYTLDGTEPTESSRPYTAPITVQPNMTLKVRAFVSHAKPSNTVVHTYAPKGLMPTKAPKAPVRTPVATQPASAPATIAPAAGVGQ